MASNKNRCLYRADFKSFIEAARSLYENHSVEDITRHEADNVSTDATIAYILDVINRSKQNREKSICFVTGVPGAGKTLVGLEVDYACVLWDADMRYDDGKWSFWKFNGKTQWIPEDPTRHPFFYDPTYEYFKGLGIEEI